jgi:hypothetical protein
MSLTGTMNDLKLAILRTFESTIKALLANSDSEIECVFDANTRNSADLGEICAELREIRTELAEMRAQITQLEKRLEHKEKAEDCCAGTKKVANIVINDVWPTADDIDDDMFRRSLLGQMPIPLRGSDAVKVVPIVQHVVPAPITPELRPRAQETEENVPDIHENGEEGEEGGAEGVEEEEVEEEDVEEEEVEEEEEEEEEAMKEVDYKDMTYYMDGENLVYTLNDEGDLNDDPVGRWYEDKKIVKFFAKPAQIRT